MILPPPVEEFKVRVPVKERGLEKEIFPFAEIDPFILTGPVPFCIKDPSVTAEGEEFKVPEFVIV